MDRLNKGIQTAAMGADYMDLRFQKFAGLADRFDDPALIEGET
jgi:hypothetical protein